MNSKVCSQRNTSYKKQECVQGVCDHHEHRCNGEVLLDGRYDQVEERQHSEHRDEYDIVDDGRIAFGGLRDNVAIKREYQEGEEELCADVIYQRCRNCGRMRTQRDFTWRARRDRLMKDAMVQCEINAVANSRYAQSIVYRKAGND